MAPITMRRKIQGLRRHSFDSCRKAWQNKSVNQNGYFFGHSPVELVERLSMIRAAS